MRPSLTVRLQSTAETTSRFSSSGRPRSAGERHRPAAHAPLPAPMCSSRRLGSSVRRSSKARAHRRALRPSRGRHRPGPRRPGTRRAACPGAGVGRDRRFEARRARRVGRRALLGFEQRRVGDQRVDRAPASISMRDSSSSTWAAEELFAGVGALGARRPCRACSGSRRGPCACPP